MTVYGPISSIYSNLYNMQVSWLYGCYVVLYSEVVRLGKEVEGEGLGHKSRTGVQEPVGTQDKDGLARAVRQGREWGQEG